MGSISSNHHVNQFSSKVIGGLSRIRYHGKEYSTTAPKHIYCDIPMPYYGGHPISSHKVMTSKASIGSDSGGKNHGSSYMGGFQNVEFLKLALPNLSSYYFPGAWGCCRLICDPMHLYSEFQCGQYCLPHTKGSQDCSLCVPVGEL